VLKTIRKERRCPIEVGIAASINLRKPRFSRTGRKKVHQRLGSGGRPWPPLARGIFLAQNLKFAIGSRPPKKAHSSRFYIKPQHPRMGGGGGGVVGGGGRGVAKAPHPRPQINRPSKISTRAYLSAALFCSELGGVETDRNKCKGRPDRPED
jgi:hypothetical protein